MFLDFASRTILDIADRLIYIEIRMKKNSFAPILLILVIAVVGILGYFAYKNVSGPCPKPRGRTLDEGTLHESGIGGKGWVDLGPLKIFENLTVAKGNDVVACVVRDMETDDQKLAKFEIQGNWGDIELAKSDPIYFVDGTKLFRTETFLKKIIDDEKKLRDYSTPIDYELIASEERPIERIEPFFFNSALAYKNSGDFSDPRFYLLYVSSQQDGIPVTVIGDTYNFEDCVLRKSGWKFLEFSENASVSGDGGLVVEQTNSLSGEVIKETVPMIDLHLELEKQCSNF